MKRLLLYLVTFFILCACADEGATPDTTATAAWVQQYVMPSPNWLAGIHPCEGCGGFSLARCITIMYGDLATLIPDENPLYFLRGLTIEVDGQLVIASDTEILVQGEGMTPSAQVCFDSSQFNAGLHVGVIRIQVDTRINEIYSWVFEVEDDGA